MASTARRGQVFVLAQICTEVQVMFLAESASMCLAYVSPASLKEAGGSLKIQDRAVQETRERRASAKNFAPRASISNRTFGD